MEQRPDPEILLKRAQAEELQEKRGKLKIYLGAAPGVGKTFTMLQDALARRDQGLDVIVGVVETHGRTEVEAMLKNFDILPRQKIEYRGQQVTEFDLDAALKRNPGLILVDEMAHTNAPGLRHTKRWQDIKEMLDRGINVYTTLNVQHIESLNDIVSRIIHARIQETVPDSMLELADTIELVDLPPEDLLKRLEEGKVYIPKQAEIAAENFFRKGNLIALRELALRTTAERVGTQVLLYRQGQGIKHIWPVKEKLLVCVGSSNESMRLIRSARRLAGRLQAEWVAVHVDSPIAKVSEEDRSNAIHNLRYAEKSGAETRIVSGSDIVSEIIYFAREQNITQIVLGKPKRSRFKDLLYGSLADELVRRSGEIDIYIITGDALVPKPNKQASIKQESSWKNYISAFAIVGVASLINFLLMSYLNDASMIMVYMFAITLVALFGKLIPTILATIFSVLTYDIFFVPPLFSFSSADIQYLFTFLVIVFIGIIITRLTKVTRRQAIAAHLAEQHMATLNVLSRKLASTRGVNKLLNSSVDYLGEIFNSEVVALLPENNSLIIKAHYKSNEKLSDKEMGVAQWVYDLGQMAGLGTDTLPFSHAIYIPLITPQGTIGVLRIRPLQPKRLFSPEQMHLLEACANQVALAIEVDRFQEQVHKSKLQTETDRVRNALLQSVSHDLRAPLVSVMGSATTLVEMAFELDSNKVKSIGADIYEESEELSRLINNMLAMTYLEAESVVLQNEPHSLQAILANALESLVDRLGKKPLNISLPEELPEIPLDARLIHEVFYNLIDNAIKFTPLETAIDVSIIMDGQQVLVSVLDRGPGIVPDEVNKLFDKFYRGRMLTSERGVGLGLAICRSIIKAHGGNIWAENREGGGAVFRFTLPLAT